MKKLNINKTNLATYGIVIVGFAVMQILSMLGLLTSSLKGYLIPICVYIVLAVSLNLVVGISGELSLGHAGFMGVGAFAGIVVAAVLKDVVDSNVLRLLAAMIVGGVIAGGAGVIVGVPVLRLRGDYLAIVTLAFGEILKNIIGNLYIGKDSEGKLGLQLDLEFKRCLVDGAEIKLAKKEFELLAYLISHRGQICSREQILAKVWSNEVLVLDRTIDVNITRLRTKIGKYGTYIVTRSGFGYGFRD